MKITTKKLLKDAITLQQKIMALPPKIEMIHLYNEVNMIIRKLNCQIHFNKQPIKDLPKGFSIKKTI